MKKLILSGTLFLAAIKLNAQRVTTLHINPDAATGGTISQIFDSIKYIPLETTKESLFGKIDQLIVNNKYFFILDNQTNSILIFEKNGKFHAKIEGRDKINNIASFAIDKEKKSVQFIQTQWPITYMVYYDFDGKFLKKIKQEDFHPNQFYIFPNEQTAYFNYLTNIRYKDSIVNEISIYKSSDKFQKGFFPYNQKTAELQSSDISHSNFLPWYNKSTNDSSLFYIRPYDYNIYTFSSSQIDTSFRFIFPLANSLPADYRTNPLYNGKRSKYFMNYKNMIFNISYTYQIKNNLLFSLSTWGGLLNADYYLYNLKSGNLICINKLSPDSLTSFLPIADRIYGMGKYFTYSDGTCLYSSISTLQMFNAKEATKDKHSNYPPVLQNYFATQTRKSNPVIVQLKPKGNL